MTIFSYKAHHFGFGNPSMEAMVERKKYKFSDVYVNHNEHTIFNHYAKFVMTQSNDYEEMEDKKKMLAYHILSSSQLSYYRNDIVLEAKFLFDPSPIPIHHHIKPKK